MCPDSRIDFTLGSLEGPGVVPETILPEQFFRSSTALLREKRLMLAVLEEALLDLRRIGVARTSRARRRADEVEAWFAADDESWPCSFLSICHALGLDASAVRTRLAPRQKGTRESVVPPLVVRNDAGRSAAEQTRNFARTG